MYSSVPDMHSFPFTRSQLERKRHEKTFSTTKICSPLYESLNLPFTSRNHHVNIDLAYWWSNYSAVYFFTMARCWHRLRVAYKIGTQLGLGNQESRNWRDITTHISLAKPQPPRGIFHTCSPRYSSPVKAFSSSEVEAQGQKNQNGGQSARAGCGHWGTRIHRKRVVSTWFPSRLILLSTI